MASGWRRFEARNERSSKFWEIEADGGAYRVRFGRIGSTGSEQRKQFESSNACERAIEKKISEKLRKGYTEVSAPPAAESPEAPFDVDLDATRGPSERAASMEEDELAEVAGGFTVTAIGLDARDVDAAVDVEPLRDRRWEHPEWIDEARSGLEDLGYRAIGHARISTLQGWRTLVLTHEERACYAIVYDDSDGWVDLLSALPANPEQPVWLATNAVAPLIGFVAQRPTYFTGVQLPCVKVEVLHDEFLRTRPPDVLEPVSLARLPSVYLQAWEIDARWAEQQRRSGRDVLEAARPVVRAAWARAREVLGRDPAERLRFLLDDLQIPSKERRLPENLAMAAQRGDLESVELFLEHDSRLDTRQVDSALRSAAGSRHSQVFERLARAALARGWCSESTISTHREKLRAPRQPSKLEEAFSGDAPMLLMGEPTRRHRPEGEERRRTVEQALELIHSPALSDALRDGRHARGTYLGQAVRTGESTIFDAVLALSPSRSVVSEALIDAAGHRYSRFVERLLRVGADPRMNHDDDGTALIRAAMSGDLGIVERLLAAGANPRSRFRGHSPAHHHTRGPFTGQINDELRRAARAGARGRGGAARFLQRKKALDPAAARGVAAFQAHMGHPVWSVVFVEAPPEDVTRVLVDERSDAVWQGDTADRRIVLEWPFEIVFRLRGNAWTVWLRSAGWIDGDEIVACETQARALSEALAVRTVAWLREDTSCLEEYRIFRGGDRVEHGAWDGELQSFESQDRARPKFAEDFPEPVFSVLGIFLPACHIDDDGLETRLVLYGLQPDALERLDVVKTR